MKPPVLEPSTVDMLDRIKAGDATAWDEFFKQYDRMITMVVRWRKWHFSMTLQDDVAQRIRADLLKSLPAFRKESSLDYYVKQICVRRCISEAHRQVRERNRFVPTVAEEDGVWQEVDYAADEIHDPVRAVVIAERAKALYRLLDSMGDVCRTMLRQFYIDRWSYKELSGEHNVTIGTVGGRLSRCIEKLRVLMREDVELAEDFPG